MRGVRRDVPDRYEDPDGGIIPQPPGLRRDMFEGAPI